jgi:hypothetical protein
MTHIETADVRRALEMLWTDIGVLARSPLVEQLGVVDTDERDAYKRAMALIAAILAAAQRLKRSGGGEQFALLNGCYGLEGALMRQRQLSGARPAMEELCDVAEAERALALNLERLHSHGK